MPETKLREIADHADMIIRGYAFTKAGDSIRIFNLRAALLSFLLKVMVVQ